MKIHLALALLIASVPSQTTQSSRRVPLVSGDTAPIRVLTPDVEVPPGAMILLETPVSPAGYSYAGLTVSASPDAAIWTLKASMPTARNYLAAAVVADKIYVIGGFNGAFLSTVEEYDPATDSWTVRAPMPTPRRGLSAVSVGNLIYVVGGERTARISRLWRSTTRPRTPGVQGVR